jgi:glutaredoxin
MVVTASIRSEKPNEKIIPTSSSLLSSTYVGVITQTQGAEKNNNQDSTDFTHAVFAEYATQVSCQYCHYAREALDTIYTTGDYPFYYVSLVQDKNTHAAERINDYNIIAYPTVAFDYGYNVTAGGYDGVETAFRTAINQCGTRTVADIDVSLDVAWLGEATMDISVQVKNNEAAPYTGHLHVYVCEIESSLGWNDTTGHPYTFPFLEYAINEQVSNLPSGDTYENAITWDGHDYTNGYGITFGSIHYGNIAVIAAVFNNTWHQGYAKPPDTVP